MYYMNLDENKKNNGFYTEEIHGIELCNSILMNKGIKIDEELWQYLLSLGQVKFIGNIENRQYTILDKDLFMLV